MVQWEFLARFKELSGLLLSKSQDSNDVGVP